MRKLFCAAMILLAVSAVAGAADYTPATERTPLLADWESMKYGMFIHYGMSTFTGHEFGGIPAESTVYNPTNLDVEQWVRVAKEGGMKYIVLTTKHCYGHCLWDSRYTDYDVATSSNKTDVVRAFVDACRKYGIKPGFYYILGWDVHIQDKMSVEGYNAYCLAQITELLSNYGPITEMWFDIPWDLGPNTDRYLNGIYQRVKSLQPNCVVVLNQAFTDGSVVRVMPPTTHGQNTGAPEIGLWPKDINEGEHPPPPDTGHNPRIPYNGVTYYLPMETCTTLAHHWFWVDTDSLRSVRSLLESYQATVDKKANLLLDLGPDRTGRIPEGTVRRLMELKAAIANPSLVRPSLTFGATATASNVYNEGKEGYAPGDAVDNNSLTRWATDTGATEAWLQVDLDHVCTFDGAFISEEYNRIRSYELQYQKPDGSWKTFYSGKTIGVNGATLEFPKTTAQVVRLNVTKAIAGPTIWDFELYAAK